MKSVRPCRDSTATSGLSWLNLRTRSFMTMPSTLARIVQKRSLVLALLAPKVCGGCGVAVGALTTVSAVGAPPAAAVAAGAPPAAGVGAPPAAAPPDVSVEELLLEGGAPQAARAAPAAAVRAMRSMARRE